MGTRGGCRRDVERVIELRLENFGGAIREIWLDFSLKSMDTT